MKHNYESGFKPSVTAKSHKTAMSRLLLMTLLLFAFLGGAKAEEITVYDGTATSSYVPVHGLWADAYLKCEFVIPAEELSEMEGGTISKMTFYLSSPAAVAWTGTFQVFLKEVSDATISAYSGTEGADVVYEGTLDATGETMEIVFTDSYTYKGGNLLVGVYQVTPGNYKAATFIGEEVTGACVQGYSSSSLDAISATQRNFIPKTTFEYTPGGNTTCDRPTSLAASEIDAHSAKLTWECEVYAYNVEYKKASLPDEDENWTAIEQDIENNTYTLTGLEQNTKYNARVRSVCDADADDYSNWSKVTFTTAVSCPAPTGLAVTLTPGNGKVATLAWEENGTATSWEICLNDDESDLITATTNPFQLTDLTPEATYTAKVRAVGDGEYSSWTDNITFTPTDAYTLTVNDGTTTNGYVPVYGYYADQLSKSQFIIPATDLAAMAYGTISKLTFYASNANVSWGAAEFEVYVKEVGNTTFDDVVDWTTMDKVMNAGTLAIVDNKMEITLDAPYQYLGGNLLIGVLQTVKGTYSSCNWYGVASEENVAIGGYENSKSLSYQTFLPKTTFDFTPGEAPAVLKPLGLAVNYTEGVTAEVSWTQNDDATEWIVAYKAEDADEFTEVTVTNTPQYTLSDLELGTTYEVKVCAKKGSDVSDWTIPVSFTTDACMPEDMIVVNYTLNDSYGDGWNSNYIVVVDENCNIVDALTLTSGSSATGTIKLCGSVAQFMWYPGNYPGETSWSFTDAEGNVLFEGAGSADMEAYDLLYSIDLNPYSMPTDITVSEVGPHTATVAWTETGSATAWQIGFYNSDGEIDNIVDADSNPFTLTGLDPETEYYVVVRAVGSEGESNWPCLGVDFTTTVAAPVPTELAASEVTATSALISWNGFGESYDLRYMALPDTKGFATTSNAQPKTASLNNLRGLFACAPKSFVNTNIRNINAKANANAKARNSKDNWYYYDNDEYYSGIGTGSSDVYWGIMLPAGMTSESQLTKISVYEDSEGNNDEPITLYVYAGGDTAPGELIYTETFDTEAADDWHEVTLTTPVEINPFQNLWIVLKEYGAYPASGCSVSPGDPNGRWISLDGTDWMDIADAGYNYTWMIRAYLEGTYELPGEWIEVSGINASEYELTGLDPETNYIVQVRGNFGEDGQSNWTSTQFTTGAFTDAPNNLQATELTATSTTLKWTGSQESYNVRYRSAETIDPIFADNFDNGLDNWTTIDADGDGFTWVLGSECGGVYLVTGGSLAGSGHNGSDDLVVSGSFRNLDSGGGEALTPDNYLVSPQVPLGGKVSFWVSGQDAGYAAEHFGVAVSTTGNTDPADFTTIKEWTLNADGTGTESKDQGTWGQFTVDLSAYKGQTGYIAIRHFNCTDQFMLDLDDFVYGEEIPAGEWIEATVTEPTLAISGLTPDTEYEWLVQGNLSDGTTEWVSSSFTTEPVVDITLTDNADDNSTTIETNDGAFANVTLAGRTLYKDGKWNTICLPFDVTLAGSPLEGATAKTLTNAEVTPSGEDSHVTLTFGDAVDKLVAGTPYIIMWDAAPENIEEPVFNDVTINATAENAINLAGGQVKFIGYYDAFPITSADEDIYYLISDNQLVRTGKDRTLMACRGYFSFTGAATTARQFVLDFGDGDVVTGINDIQMSQNTNSWYNVNGVKLNGKPSRKGLYIQNGQKVVIK